MVENDRPYIVMDFLTEEENEILSTFLTKISTVSPNSPNHRCALGYQGYKAASRINKENPALRLTSSEESNKAIYLITDVYERAGKVLGELYSSGLSLVQASYTEYSAGPGQGLHSDMYDKYGEIRNDNISSVMKYSAVLYLSTGGGVDYSGGELWFPTQKHRHVSTAASLACFTGDMDHMHEVESIESGVRKSLSMFYGLKEEVLA
jgi:hypothetical protein